VAISGFPIQQLAPNTAHHIFSQKTGFFYYIHSIKTPVMRKITAFIAFLIIAIAFGQKKELTLEDIWSKGTFKMESIEGLSSMSDGQHYTSLEQSDKGEMAIVKYEYKTGKKKAIIVTSSELVPAG
jgi:hypothetical protein